MKKNKIGKHGFNCATRKSSARGCCLSEPTRAGRYHSELTYYLSDANIKQTDHNYPLITNSRFDFAVLTLVYNTLS